MKSSMFLIASTIVLIFALFFNSFLFHTKEKHGSKLSQVLETFPVEGAFGPESLAFDAAGEGPYAGISGGRIIKWLPYQRRWVDFAFASPLRCTTSLQLLFFYSSFCLIFVMWLPIRTNATCSVQHVSFMSDIIVKSKCIYHYENSVLVFVKFETL